MTNYEKIKFLLEMGVYKGVRVLLDGKVKQHDIVISDQSELTRKKPDLEEFNVTSITPIPNPPKLLPVGTKVRVFEEYDNKYGKMECLYSVYEELDSQYALLGLDDGQSYVVPARAVVPVLD